MHPRKVYRGLALGLVSALAAGLAGCASTRPASDEEISQAAVMAEQRNNAVRPLATDNSMYRLEEDRAKVLAAAVRRSGAGGSTGQAEPTIRVEPVQLSATQPADAEAGTEVAARAMREDLEGERTEPVFSIQRDLRERPQVLWRDAKRVYTNPLNLALLLTAGGASIALHQDADSSIAEKFDRAHTCTNAWRNTSNVLGNPALHFGVAGAWYLAGYRSQDAKTYNVGKTLFSALVITDLSTLTLKVASNREGPDGDNLGWPSGHASSTFALASVMHQSYGLKAGVPLYALAGWVSFERLDDREHFLSDVIFGGTLGLVIGHTVASGHMPEIAGGTIIPYSDPTTGATGIAWWKTTK